MLTQRTTVHKTKRGRIIRHIAEHYLRDDVFCGLNCSQCKHQLPFEFPQHPTQSPYPQHATLFTTVQDKLHELLQQTQQSQAPSQTFQSPSLQSTHLQHYLTKLLSLLQQFSSNNTSSPSIILVPETNIFLQQFDFLETQTIPFSNLIILQSSLTHLQRKHYKVYQKLRALCTTTTFQSSTLLKSNFESKSYSICNSSQDQTITPHLYVFSDLHHRQVYTSAIDQVGDITEDIFIPYNIDPVTKAKLLDESDDNDSKSFFPQSPDSNEHDDFVIPDSFVQYVNIEVNPNNNNNNNTTDPQPLPLDSEQTFEQHYLNELFLSANKWYHRHQTNNTCIMGLTIDLQTALKHIELGIPAIPIDLYISLFLTLHPGYESLYAHCVQEQHTRDRSQWVYKEHLTPQQIESGVVSGSIYTGKLNIDRDYWSQGSISTDEHGRILIPGLQYMNRAFDGDFVAVKLWPKELWHELATGLAPDPDKEISVSEQQEKNSLSNLDGNILDNNIKQINNVDEDYIPTAESTLSNVDPLATSLNQRVTVPTGEIVGIVQQNNRIFCGSIELTDRQEGSVLFLPYNRRIPKIFIHSRQLQNICASRLLVRVDSWPITSRHPNGHITRILGNIGDNEAETEMILIEHDIKHDKWSLAVEKCLPPPEYVIDDQERAGRVDLRGVDICSIDPPGCTDIDDALHCVRLPNGNFEVGVHIADVTHYMKPGSALDIEAAKRSTSVYLVDRRIDMIPARLSTNLCSLHEHVERLAFSTVWELSPDADIISVKFFKSVILSRGAMTYAQAQERIDLELEHCSTPELKELYYDKLTQPCKDLMMLAKKIKQHRFDKGALSLASNEVKFKLNMDRTAADDMVIYQLKDANSLVEEFMLLANVSVAEHTLRYFPLLALLRGHPTPPEEMLLPLVKAAKSWGYDVDISNGKTMSDSLDNIVDPNNPMFNKVLRVLTTRCMTQAKYMSSGEITNLKQLHHFGLAATTYTHFTSPIRRYSDCIVHRLLATSLGIHPLPEAIKDKAHMRDVVENLNYRHRQAQMASRASNDIWVLKYFTGKDITANALILAVKSTGVRVIVQQYGIECAVRLVPSDLTSKVQTVHFTTVEENQTLTPKIGYFYNPELMTLTLNGSSFQCLQSIQVRLCVKENKARRRWLNVELAGDSKELITIDLLQSLYQESVQDSIELTPDILAQRELEASNNNNNDPSIVAPTTAVISTSTNTGSAELYITNSQQLTNDELFKPIPCDDEMAQIVDVNNRDNNNVHEIVSDIDESFKEVKRSKHNPRRNKKNGNH